jgi:hypothetical protein
LGEGTYTPSLATTDPAGNTSVKDGTLFTVDLTLPVTSGITGALTVDPRHQQQPSR